MQDSIKESNKKMHTVSKVDTIFPWSNRKYTLSLHRNTNKKNENMTLPHIGELIKAEVERQGLTKAVFAETIGTTTRNVHKIFKKENLDLILLGNISKALKHDFFRDITDHPEILRLEDPETINYLEEKKARAQFLEVMPSVLKKLDAVPLVSFGAKEQFGEGAPVPDFLLPDYRISFCVGISLKERLIDYRTDNCQVLVVSDHKGKEFDVFMDTNKNEIIMIDIKLDFKTEEQWLDMMSYVFGYLFHDGFREDRTPEFINGHKELNAFFR